MTHVEAVEKVQRLEKLVDEIKTTASCLGTPQSRLDEIWQLIRAYEKEIE